MKKISCFFLFTLVFLGCGDEPSSEDEVVKHLVEDELVFDTEPRKKITWETDGKEMVLIPAASFEMGDHFDEGSKNFCLKQKNFYYLKNQICIQIFLSISLIVLQNLYIYSQSCPLDAV